MKTIQKSKKIKVPAEALKLFDAANKRVNRLEKAGINYKQAVTGFRSTARAMGAQFGVKTNRLSMAKNMGEKYYKAQLKLARQVMQRDELFKVRVVKKVMAEQQKKLKETINERYPNLGENTDNVIDHIIKYNQEHYESSFIQWLYESWKNNKANPEDERGLMRILDVAAAHGQTVEQTLSELDKLAHERTGFSWQGLAREYIKKW